MRVVYDYFDAERILEKNISEKYGGTGLGLDIAKQFVELHGGEIRARANMVRGARSLSRCR